MSKRLYSGFPIFLFLLMSAFSMQSHAAVVGMWRTEHPDLGVMFFRIKTDQTCSYFLKRGIDTTIYNGRWQEIPTGYELRFTNGVVLNVGELETGVLDVRMNLSSGHDVADTMVVARAELVQSSEIGALTVDPNRSDDEERVGYFGAWEGEFLDGQKFYLLVNDDRTIGANMGAFSENRKPVVGFWRMDGEKLQMFWNDASFATIETVGRRIELTWFEPGALLEDARGYTTRILPIQRNTLPQEWHDEFRTDYVTRMPIVVLRQLSQIRAFFRGRWMVGSEADTASLDTKPYIDLRRFGNAYTNRYGGIRGNWHPGADTASIIWRNGVRETLSTVGNQFVVQSFNPSQPTSGRPARIEVANPKDERKVGYYVNRKRELLDPSRFLRELQRAAEGR